MGGDEERDSSIDVEGERPEADYGAISRASWLEDARTLDAVATRVKRETARAGILRAALRASSKEGKIVRCSCLGEMRKLPYL